MGEKKQGIANLVRCLARVTIEINGVNIVLMAYQSCKAKEWNTILFIEDERNGEKELLLHRTVEVFAD